MCGPNRERVQASTPSVPITYISAPCLIPGSISIEAGHTRVVVRVPQAVLPLKSFSKSSAAVEFLMSNGFRMEAPFTEGIPYLSRVEEKKAKQSSREREVRKAKISEIAVDQLDDDAVAFLDLARNRINESIQSGEVRTQILKYGSYGQC